LDAIILAAGSGTRMKAGMNKVLIKINEKPMICYTLDAFEKSNCIDKIILVINKSDAEFYSEFKTEYSKIDKIVFGGATRQESSYIGISNSESEYIMIHDAARPLITTDDILKISEAVEENIAVTLGAACIDTMKLCDKAGIVKSSVIREELFKIYTPQAFNRKKLIELHKDAVNNGVNVTDDCSLYENNNLTIKVICGSATNIKLTTPEDVDYAEYIINKRNNL